MRKLLSILFLLLFSAPAFANGVKIGDLYYLLDENSKTASVTYSTDSEPSYDNPPYTNITGEVAIPSKVDYNGVEYSVTEIGEDAFFYCSGLTSVTIANSVTEIGDYAFLGCNGLTSVTIPNSVNSIGSGAFVGCSGLIKVEISDIDAWCKIEFSNYDSNPLYYAKHLYLNGNEVKDLIIPNSVTEIGDYAFLGCSGLTSVTIPNSVTEIGKSAFRVCSGLTSVTIPNSVIEIGDGAFSWCSGLTSVTISNSVTSIRYETFSYCTGLTSVTIPNSVTEIGNLAFYYCSGLASVTIPNSVTSIGFHAFSDCTGLKKSAYPSTISNPFSYGYAVKYPAEDILFENGFIYDKNKTCVYFAPLDLSDVFEVPSTITAIGDYAFAYCEDLKNLVTGTSLYQIGTYAFKDCNKLETISFKTNGLLNIGDYAFNGCKNIDRITCRATRPPYAKDYNIFEDEIYNSANLYVPSEQLNLYYSTVPWNRFFNISNLEASGIEDVISADIEYYTVYDLNGGLILSNATKESLDTLTPGVYIINGKKVIVK